MADRDEDELRYAYECIGGPRDGVRVAHLEDVIPIFAFNCFPPVKIGEYRLEGEDGLRWIWHEMTAIEEEE